MEINKHKKKSSVYVSLTSNQLLINNANKYNKLKLVCV